MRCVAINFCGSQSYEFEVESITWKCTSDNKYPLIISSIMLIEAVFQGNFITWFCRDHHNCGFYFNPGVTDYFGSIISADQESLPKKITTAQ